MNNKERFIEIYTKYIKREGADKLLDFLLKSDFFTAPASTKYHCACENGLVMHSVSVFNTMMEKHFEEGVDSIESFAI
jgi:23S rRNA maturation-related 3'-5' exoribonuclease YhaM